MEYACSPFTSAAGFTDLMHLVMETGAKPELLNQIKKTENLNQKNTAGWTALMLSCRNSSTLSSIATVKLLLELGADPNLQENKGTTALIMACLYSQTDSSIDVVKLLIDFGANLDLQDNDGWTALMTANRYSNNVEMVKLLINYGANLNIQENNGWTALMLTCYYSQIESNIKLLINYHVDCNIQSKNGRTALMIACQYKFKPVMPLLFANSNLNMKDNHGKTVLEYAIEAGVTDMYLHAFENKTSVSCYKKFIFNFVLKQIPLQNRIIRMHPTSMGYLITKAHFESDFSSLILMDYLSAGDAMDLCQKINSYLQFE